MAIKMVLFNLDGTLLPMDMDVFTGGRLRGKGSERQEKNSFQTIPLSQENLFFSSENGQYGEKK